MDADRFDRFSRAVSRGLSRRGLLRGSLAGVAAILAPRAAPRQAAAGTRCIPDGENCADICGGGNPCNACCNGFCAAYGGCTDIGWLGLGQTCDLAESYACEAGYTCCPFRPGQRHGQGTCQDVCY